MSEQTRALWAVRQMQEESKRRGLDTMTMEEINAIIKEARQEIREERQRREQGQ